MPRLAPSLPPGPFRYAAAVMLAIATVECPAIEMFTFYGADGSRIGLPSLEVPVEAYRGIPLRSDRLRARRAARRRGVEPAAAATAGMPPLPRGMTIREMPPVQPPAAMPRTRPAAGRAAAPLAPAPEDILPGRVPAPLAE